VLGGGSGPRSGQRWPALAMMGAVALVIAVLIMRACS
jgi:hypothetical protein